MLPYQLIYIVLFQDLNLSTERLASNKAFTNKLWNAGKFVLQNLPDQNDASTWESILAYKVCHVHSVLMRSVK
jgi:valyl-tRNA synthetase